MSTVKLLLEPAGLAFARKMQVCLELAADPIASDELRARAHAALQTAIVASTPLLLAETAMDAVLLERG